MDSWKYICLLLAYLTIVSGFSISSIDQSRGRKLFGGYRIVPKICQPANPSRIKSNEPAICMFNYECSRRLGEVVGACMDGFLFGACCQLPTSISSPSSSLSDVYHSAETSPLLINEKLDHVPDIPILTNPDGTPLDDTTIDLRDTTKPSSSSSHFTSSQISELEQNFPAFLGSQSIIDDLSMPVLLSHSDANNDIQEQKETISDINPVTTLLHPDQVLQISDPVDQLPGLFSQGLGPSNHTIAETILINKNGTIVDETNNPDILFKPANRSTALPNYFTNSDMATTKMLPVKYVNTEKFVDSTTQSTSTAELVRVQTISYDTNSQSGNNKKHDDEYNREEIAINHIISILNGSTPNSSSKSPTRTTTQYSSNSPSTTHTWVTLDETSVPSTSSGTSSNTFYKPSTKPANFYYYESGFPSTTENVAQSATTRPSFSSYYTTINQNYPSTYSSSSSNYPYSSKPTTLAPAPTVIVLGPFDTSDTTTDVTSHKPFVTRKPISTSIRPNLLTKKPNMGATITHNISTIISTDDTATASATSNIISTSYVNFKLKEPNVPSSITTEPEIITKRPTTIWTTLSTWSSKPSFQLRPGKPELDWPQENLTPVHTLTFKATDKPLTISNVDSDEGTAAPDELSNFPPDRNPNLTNTTLTSQQEKPTIIVTSNNTGYPLIEHISENEIPTPQFVKDESLNNRVDDFVNKIVDSLQNNFQSLKDVVYTRKNVSTSTPGSSTVVTQKPPTRRPTGKPTGTRKPTIKRPNTSLKPGTTGGSATKPVKVTRLPKPTTPRPLGSADVTTKKIITSTTTRRPKPTKKVATTVAQTSTTSVSTTVEIVAQDTGESSEIAETTTREPDFRSDCGVRPLMKKGRVVGGKGAQFGEWPWQVLVREATWLGLFTKNKCGGVLITDNYVITAAHCQPGFLASLVAVFGEHDISGKLESRASITRNVKRVIVHRAYNPATFENDLALLELESPIEFDAHIVPICMPPDNADFTGRMATVTGWGRVKYNGGVPSILQEVQVPVMENVVCQDMFTTAGHSKIILDSFLCAGYANGQKDSCEGDSGGPLMMEGPDGRWQLVGTVSHGIKCAAPYLPGVYMRTTYFKPWLHSVTGV